MRNDRALILFARLPLPGKVKTRLARTIGNEAAARAYDELAQHAFTVADGLRLEGVSVRVYHAPGALRAEMASWVGRPFDLAEQQGRDLGERMRAAFEDAFGRGFTRAVLVGTDIPGLSAAIVDAAFALLDTHPIVLGPAADGGYYLIGMRPPPLDVFEGVPWSTKDVCRLTLERVRTLGVQAGLVETLADVDSFEDFDAWRNSRSAPEA